MSPNRILPLLALAFIAVSPLCAHGQPVPEDERIPVDFRRTTLVVRDIEASLKLYRDALGMTQIYDQVITSGQPARK